MRVGGLDVLKKDTSPNSFSRAVAVGKINAVLARATSDRDEQVRILETALMIAKRGRT